MNVDISKLVDDFVSAPLFQDVAEPIKDASVKTVADWPACWTSMNGNKWVNIGTTIFNRIFARAQADRGADWYRQTWNGWIDDLKKQIAKRTGSIVRRVMKQHELPKKFQYFIEGDVLQAYLLSEFPDEPSLAWSEQLMRWYRRAMSRADSPAACLQGRAVTQRFFLT
jgi:hypothetical protein